MNYRLNGFPNYDCPDSQREWFEYFSEETGCDGCTLEKCIGELCSLLDHQEEFDLEE